MDHDAFLGEAQHRLDVASQGEAARATRVVLNTLGERLGEGEAQDLAAALPMEIDRYLTEPAGGERFSYQEFLERIAERANVDEADANYYAQAIVALVAECAPGGEIDQVRQQLPDDYEDLFEFAGAEAAPW